MASIGYQIAAIHKKSGAAIVSDVPSICCIYYSGHGLPLYVGEDRTMTKADLVEEVTQLGDLTRRDGEMIVDTIFDSVIHALRTGDKIEIRGFGSFRIRQRKPRTGRNPKTGAKVDVPAKRVPYFKPSKELRDLVNPKNNGPEPDENKPESAA
jgi:integration host factor subunit beta